MQIYIRFHDMITRHAFQLRKDIRISFSNIIRVPKYMMNCCTILRVDDLMLAG